MDEKDYAARVRNLKASRFLYRADVIARVESEDDIAFWQSYTSCAPFCEGEVYSR